MADRRVILDRLSKEIGKNGSADPETVKSFYDELARGDKMSQEFDIVGTILVRQSMRKEKSIRQASYKQGIPVGTPDPMFK